MYEPIEDSGPLNRGVPRRWAARSFLAFVGVVVVMAIFSAPNGSPSNARRQSSIDPNSPKSFDDRYRAWETSVYRRAMEVDMEGSSAGMKLERLGSTKLTEDQTEANVIKGDEKATQANVTQDLVYLNTSTAAKMFVATKPSATRHFYYYQQGWDAQINQAYCAVASTMAVLNSLRGKISLPEDPVYSPYPWATQEDLMQNQCVKDTIYDIDTMDKEFWGLGLDMAANFINCFLNGQGFNATAYHVNRTTEFAGEVRDVFLGALADEDTRILINYDRGALGQGPLGHGHFSPIGAYSFHMDSFLIMDVAKYEYPPVWVPTSTLMQGIGSIDACAISEYDKSLSSDADLANGMGCQPAYRGYILIQNVTK